MKQIHSCTDVCILPYGMQTRHGTTTKNNRAINPPLHKLPTVQQPCIIHTAGRCPCPGSTSGSSPTGCSGEHENLLTL